MPIIYKDVKLNHGYRMDILIENKVVIEVKSVEAITPVHEAQLLTYLKLGNFKLGLILNFHVSVMKNGIKRMVMICNIKRMFISTAKARKEDAKLRKEFSISSLRFFAPLRNFAVQSE